MKISFNWLKDYIKTDLTVEQVSKILTDIGLEVEGLEKIESIKGGLNGIVIGEVLTKTKHPNADRLNITTVDIGLDNPLQIVCGAPNVDVGQKVPVATIGTTLYSAQDSFKIKKGKIRGEVSEGMICSEDELGLGNDHDGIMILDPNTKVGTLGADYFKIESDYIIEIGLTPNRSDAMSHIGVARDLHAALNHQNIKSNFKLPEIKNFKVPEFQMDVFIENHDACPRYSGICIKNVKVEHSPTWLQNRLKSIGLTPINNIVDITNYVLHETGQPLHAFDKNAIKGSKIKVQQLKEKTKFTTLDNITRELSNEDLMICDGENNGMCIAGVFGGLNSGVTDKTTNLFIESAYFNPINIRKTAKRHALSTDASFRFERSVDPNLVIYALKRSVNLILDIAGGEVSSAIVDLYPNKISNFEINLSFEKVNKILGHNIEPNIIIDILKSLEIDVISENNKTIKLSVPPYRVDVRREEDVIEEILRIYGYNNIKLPNFLKSSLNFSNKINQEHIQNIISDLLSSMGFNECMNNSLTKSSYNIYIDESDDQHVVKLLNPLSKDLDSLRQSLLFSSLENTSFNINRKSSDLSFYEFGKTYSYDKEYKEYKKLIITATGYDTVENWKNKRRKKDFFWLKNKVESVLNRLGLKNYKGNHSSISFLTDGYKFSIKKDDLVNFGYVKIELQKKFDIKQPVLHAEFNWDLILKHLKLNNTKVKSINKFPVVRRDLALLIDKETEFKTLKNIAFQCEQKLLKEVNLFDEYQGEKLPNGKKSYALSFVLEDHEKTLQDHQIESIIEKLITAFKEKANAEVRM